MLSLESGEDACGHIRPWLEVDAKRGRKSEGGASVELEESEDEGSDFGIAVHGSEGSSDDDDEN